MPGPLAGGPVHTKTFLGLDSEKHKLFSDLTLDTNPNRPLVE